MEILDKCCKYDARTELPSAFEESFFRTVRGRREPLVEYLNRFKVAERKVRRHDINLPDAVLGWMLLRRSGMDRESKTFILTTIGKNLTWDSVEDALKMAFGMDSLPNQRSSTGAGFYLADYVDDNDGYEYE